MTKTRYTWCTETRSTLRDSESSPCLLSRGQVEHDHIILLKCSSEEFSDETSEPTFLFLVPSNGGLPVVSLGERHFPSDCQMYVNCLVQQLLHNLSRGLYEVVARVRPLSMSTVQPLQSLEFAILQNVFLATKVVAEFPFAVFLPLRWWLVPHCRKYQNVRRCFLTALSCKRPQTLQLQVG